MNTTATTAPLIEAHQLTVRFGKVTALNGLELTVPPGEVLAILGPNGAGKTTFVRTIATLVRPTSGTLRILGNDVARHPVAVRRDIGLAGQFAAVETTMTGRENLEMTARLFGHSGRAVRQVADAVIEQLSLEEVADRRSSTYSGGQRRRLDLGASLVGAPRLLLLDEPTTGLDPTSRREVWDAVRQLTATGTNVLLTTHYLDEASEFADRIVIIDHGVSIASGTLDELTADVGLDVIEVGTADTATLDRVSLVLERAASAPARIDRDRRRVSVPAAGGLAELASVVRGLKEASVAVVEVGIRKPSLDEIFLAITAQHSEAGSPTSVKTGT